MIITVRYASQTKVEISPLEGVHFGVSAIHSLSAEHIQSYFLTCSAHTYHRIYVTFHIVISLYRFIQSTNKNVIFRLFNSLKKGFNASIKLKKMSNIEEELENVQEDVREQNIQRNRNPKKKNQVQNHPNQTRMIQFSKYYKHILKEINPGKSNAMSWIANPQFHVGKNTILKDISNQNTQHYSVNCSRLCCVRKSNVN